MNGRLKALLLLSALLACARVVRGPGPPAPPAGDGAAGAGAGELAQPSAPVPPPGEAASPGPHIGPVVPPLVRVGLATDLERLTLPCCEQDLVAEAEGARVPLVSALLVEPASASRRPAAYRLQVAALKDELQANGLAEQLAEAAGESGSVVFDARSDLYRVRWGRFALRDDAERARRRLELLGLRGVFVVSEGVGEFEHALKVTQGGRTWHVSGRWLSIRAQQEEPVRVLDGRYHGRLLIYLNDRGTLNLINEVSLEDYLRGVVPREMGPRLYSNLEALKAQAVAARSYTVRNLGGFTGEGYDICATPRCQVYGGVGVEDPLSNRAVAETAGEVLLYEGEVVDAMYSSTCGGHTENVHVVFPLKNEPYLKGVPCLEAGLDQLGGAVADGTEFPGGLTLALLPPAGPRREPEMLEARLEHLAFLAGLPAPAGHLASLERREVQRYLAQLLDLALDSKMFVAEADIAYLVGEPPAGWGPEDLRLAAYLGRYGLLTGDPAEPIGAREIESTLLNLALLLRVVERVDANYDGVRSEHLLVREDGQRHLYELAPTLGTFRRRGEEYRAAPLGLVPGDRLALYKRGDEVLAVTHVADPDGVAFDRTSELSTWTRFRSDTRLRELVAQRYPGFELASFQILSRGVSGRVGRIRLLGRDGRALEVDGLAIRWTLDIPDTLFTMRRLDPPDREGGWLLTGRGWGHGVGLCQVGAYGMGVRGHGYRDILAHYYTGVTFGRLRTIPRDQFDALR